MRLRSRCTFALVAVLFAFRGEAFAETSDASFQHGNARFAAGDYPGAITAYEQVVRTGAWSPNLFYNLGNARFREGDLGRAILNYLRTIALERDHLEANANMRLVRAQAQTVAFSPSPILHYIGLVSSDTYASVGAILFWAGVLLLVWRRRGFLLALAVLSLIVAAGCGISLFQLESALAGRAIIVAKDVHARVATADTAATMLALPPGSEVRILQRRGDWTYAELPNNQRGWIAANAAELIRL